MAATDRFTGDRLDRLMGWLRDHGRTWRYFIARRLHMDVRGDDRIVRWRNCDMELTKGGRKWTSLKS